MWTAAEFQQCMTTDDIGSMMYMDELHVLLLHELAMAVCLHHVIEVGCWDGFSTSAFVAAQRAAMPMQLTCVDVNIRPKLFETLKKSPGQWRAWQTYSANALRQSEMYDVAVIDGDHSLSTVQEEARIVLGRNTGTIILHDAGRERGCPGPQWFRDVLDHDFRYKVLVDEKPREGMATDRGLLLATRDKDVWEAAHDVWPL